MHRILKSPEAIQVGSTISGVDRTNNDAVGTQDMQALVNNSKPGLITFLEDDLGAKADGIATPTEITQQAIDHWMSVDTPNADLQALLGTNPDIAAKIGLSWAQVFGENGAPLSLGLSTPPEKNATMFGSLGDLLSAASTFLNSPAGTTTSNQRFGDIRTPGTGIL